MENALTDSHDILDHFHAPKMQETCSHRNTAQLSPEEIQSVSLFPFNISHLMILDTEQRNFQPEKESYEDICGHYISRCLFLILSIVPYWKGRYSFHNKENVIGMLKYLTYTLLIQKI